MSDHGVDHYLNLFFEFREMTSRIFSSLKCEYIKSLGDGFMYVAPDSGAAVEAALKLMKAIDARNQNLDDARRRFEIRIGIDYGQTTLDVHKDQKDRFGECVIAASRLEGLSAENCDGTLKARLPDGPRILISKKVRKHLNDEFSCNELGSVELKGFDVAHNVYSVQWK